MSIGHIFGANAGDGRKVYLAAVQAAEGTIDSLTTGTDEKLYDEGSYLSPKRETLSPNVVSPSYPGATVYTTNEYVEAKIISRIFHRAISSANSSDVPHPHELLLASGWEWTADSTDKTHTYILTANQGSVLSAAMARLNANNTKNRTIHGGDIRGNSVISARYGKEWLVTFDGMGRNNDSVNIRSLDSNPWSTVGANLPGNTRLPMMARGSSLYLYDQAGTTLYGGGSLGSPGSTGELLGFSFDGGRAVAKRGGIGATSGIHGAVAALGRPTLDLTLECNDNDLHFWQSQSKALLFRIRSTQPGASGNTLTFGCGGFISEVNDDEIDEGRYVAKVKIALGWPNDVSDNAPLIGTNPLSPWTTASNLGVPLLPAATLPVGIAFLQFATAT